MWSKVYFRFIGGLVFTAISLIGCDKDFNDFSSKEKRVLLDSLRILQDSIDKSSNNELVKKYAEKYFELANELNIFLPKSYLNLGFSYWQVTDYKNAYKYLTNAIHHGKKLKDTITLIDSYIYLSLIQEKFGDFKTSDSLVNEAYNLSFNIKDPLRKASVNWNKSNLFYRNNKSDSCLYYALKAVEIMNTSKFQDSYWLNFGLGLSYWYLSSAYELSGNYDLCLISADSSVYFSSLINDLNTIVGINSNVAYYYFKQKLYNNAIKKSIYNLELIPKINNLEYLSWNYINISESYEALSNSDSAFKYLKLFNLINDSIKNNDIKIQMVKQEIKMKNKEIIDKDTINLYTIIVSITSVFILLMIIYLLISKYRLKNKISMELTELNKTKDKFFSIISHDLRTPLNSINTLITLLSEYYDEFTVEEIKNHISTLKKSSDNILVLLENLLLWAKVQLKGIEALQEEIIIAQLINEEIENLRESAAVKQISIVNNVESEHVVFADRDMISVVIRNLLSNAIKFSYENSKIEINGNIIDDFLRIAVIDYGIGISENAGAKIFKLESKFSTLGTNNEKGSGLGLTLCKDFIQKYNGSIWFENNSMKGTTFFITLPLTKH